MKKRTLFARLGIFLIGLPLVLLIVFIRFHAHFALHFLICLVSLASANELYDIFSRQFKLLNKVYILILTLSVPLVAALVAIVPSFFEVAIPHGQELITYTFIVTMLLVLAAEVFTAKTFEDSNKRMAGSAFIILYCGYLVTFISRMTVFNKCGQDVSSAFIATFLLMVFLCDSFAWFFGVLFGKNNKGLIKASPNKSIAGFAGGFLGSVFAGILCFTLRSEVFSGSVAKVVVLGILIAFSSIVGDLAESVFKRSSGVKDSGRIIPGRGGILDSIDSIYMSAPIYYFLVTLLYL